MNPYLLITGRRILRAATMREVLVYVVFFCTDGFWDAVRSGTMPDRSG
jgi:hypothetical protein